MTPLFQNLPGILIYLLSATVQAAVSRADLRTTMTGPAQIAVGVSAHYQVSVYSIGQIAQTGSKVTITMPIGSVASGYPSGCSVNSTYQLICNLGSGPSYSLAPLGNTVPAATIGFDMVSSAPRTAQFTAKSSGKSNDYTPANNVATINLTVLTSTVNNINIVGPRNARIDACTFSGPILPSHTFSSCSASSLVGYNLILAADNTISIEGTNSGAWSQANQQSIHIDVQEAGQPISVIYNGTSVSPTCFDGQVTFVNNSNYHSAFRLCLQ